jgi:hypothetical protein
VIPTKNKEERQRKEGRMVGYSIGRIEEGCSHLSKWRLGGPC